MQTGQIAMSHSADLIKLLCPYKFDQRTPSLLTDFFLNQAPPGSSAAFAMHFAYLHTHLYLLWSLVNG